MQNVFTRTCHRVSRISKSITSTLPKLQNSRETLKIWAIDFAFALNRKTLIRRWQPCGYHSNNVRGALACLFAVSRRQLSVFCFVSQWRVWFRCLFVSGLLEMFLIQTPNFLSKEFLSMVQGVLDLNPVDRFTSRVGC